MIPLINPLGSFLACTLVHAVSNKTVLSNVRARGRIALSIMLVSTGISHFTNAQQFVDIPDLR